MDNNVFLQEYLLCDAEYQVKMKKSKRWRLEKMLILTSPHPVRLTQVQFGASEHWQH